MRVGTGICKKRKANVRSRAHGREAISHRPGDKIVVEKLDGNAGDRITLGDVLLAGEGSSLKSTDGLTVAAEIVAQAKADKVTVFKKRRRHNYRRKKGHRQQHTILKIVAIGDHKETKKAAPKAETPAKPHQGQGDDGRGEPGRRRRGDPDRESGPQERQGCRRRKAGRQEGCSGQGQGRIPVDRKCCTC